MSAAIASRRRPSRMASAMRGSSSTINTRMLSMLPAGSISSAYRKPHTCWQHHAALNGGVTYSEPVRARTCRIRIRRIRPAGLLVVIVAIAAALGYELLASSSSTAPSSSTAASPIDVLRGEHRGLRSEHRGALGEAGGAVPDGTTLFDDEVPGVANLYPALLRALRRAATDAAAD